MKKRMLSLLLAAMMCVGMLPAALADEAAEPQSADAHAAHRLCNDGSCTDTNHDHTEITDWQGVTSLPKSAGHYYLENDVQTGSTWTPADGVVLCLNGFSIIETSSVDAIKVDDGQSFTLTDCKDSGEITHQSGKTGRGVLVNGTAVFNMYGGSIANNKSSKEGAGVSALGTFNMYGGSIKNNDMTAESNYSGGGVCVGPYGRSGSVVYDATFNLYDGEITGNTSQNGSGGVNVTSGSKFFMHGGSISKNKSRNGGGGVNAGHSEFTMTGGSITENESSGNGAGVYVSKYSYEAVNFKVSGTVVITGNKKSNTPNDVYLDGVASSYSSSRTYTIMGIGEDGLDSKAEIGITTMFTPSEGKPVPIVDANGTDYSGNFFSDAGYYVNYNADNKLELTSASAGHVHYLCGETCTGVGGHTDKRTVFEEWNKTDSLPTTAGNYYLAQNVTLSEAWEPADGVALCLNGHTITMKNPDDTTDEVNVINVADHFTLTDCQNSGVITHAADKNGKGVNVEGGTFDMYGGKITGNTTEYDRGGSGVSVRGVSDTTKSTVFRLYGGEISGNTAKSGGGVHVSRVVWYGPSEFYMYGGKITNNIADSDIGSYGVGGGVYVSWTSKFAMTGGEITGNTANQFGGGVYASALARASAYTSGGVATVEVAGDARITGNTADSKVSNVYLDSDTAESNFETVSAVLALTGEPTGAIGVTSPRTPEVNSPVTIATGAADRDYSGIITSDDSDYEVQRRNHTLVLALPGDTHEHNWKYAGNGTDTITLNCAAEGCTVDGGGWIKVIAPENLTYDGQPKAAALTTSDDWLGEPVEDIKIEYNKKLGEGTTTPLTYDPPTEPGEYGAWFRLRNPKDATSVEYVWAHVDFTIAASENGGSSSDNGSSSGDNSSSGGSTGGSSSGGSSSGSHSSSSSSSRYTVSTSSGTGSGTVKANTSSASKGDTVTVTVTPQNGYQLEKLTVTDAKGNVIAVTDKGDGKFTFVMPASKVEIVPVFAAETEPETENSFADVKSDDYFFDAVKWAAEQAITNGITKDSFMPDNGCTRAQIVTFLWRAAGSPEPEKLSEFTDVPSDKYYAKAVAWAVENGITTGLTEQLFAPDATCTRAHSVTFLYRAAKASASGDSAFTDVDAGAYYAAAVKWATDNGITNGLSADRFGSDSTCTRAQIVTFLWRLYAEK